MQVMEFVSVLESSKAEIKQAIMEIDYLDFSMTLNELELRGISLIEKLEQVERKLSSCFVGGVIEAVQAIDNLIHNPIGEGFILDERLADEAKEKLQENLSVLLLI